MFSGQAPTWITVLPAYLSALGTFTAVLVSLRLATRAVRRQRAQELRQQAENLTAWYVPLSFSDANNAGYIGLRVNNASGQLFYDVIAQNVAVQGAARTTAIGDTQERNRQEGVLIGNIPPGEITTRIRAPDMGMHRRFWIELAYQDAGGRFWVRHANGQLEQVKKHPVDLYNISRPVRWEDPVE